MKLRRDDTVHDVDYCLYEDYQKLEARIAELEKQLADAEVLLKPFLSKEGDF